jgi:hypothetical protein
MANHPSVTAFVEMTNAMNRYAADMDILIQDFDEIPACGVPILALQLFCHRLSLENQLCDFQETLLLGGEPRSVIEASITCVRDLIDKIDAVIQLCINKP